MGLDPTRNPFSALAIHPRATPAEITELLRELAEEASPEERRLLQEQWRALTLHPEDRLRAAFFAHTDPRRDLHPLSDDLTPDLLLRRYRLPAPPPLRPEELLGAPPDPASLTLLPTLATATSPRRDAAPEPWPTLAPDDDPLLKL